jgi:CIC family chloride channel protein
MTFLVLESTGDLSVAGGVLAASIATSLAVRATFGYSFTTWRLHLRGESIRGSYDVGWLRDLTVARLMQRAPPTTPAEASVRAFRDAYPLGSAQFVVAVDPTGRYRGLVQVAEAYADTLGEGENGGPISALARLRETSLLPELEVRSALEIFEAAATDTLAVAERDTGLVVGTLSEAFAARRYAQETSMAAKGVLGGGW